MLAYVESLKEKMALPDLTTILDPAKPPATVGPRTSVREAAQLMKDRRTTAVCVMEVVGGQSKIVGIFTSKDVVLRVIAAGLDSQRCSVVRVMTPHPDTAPPTMFVQDALKKMHSESLAKSTNHLARADSYFCALQMDTTLTSPLSRRDVWSALSMFSSSPTLR